MKKLNLQLGSIKEMLTKEEMKKISGGYNSCRGCGSGGGGHQGQVHRARCCLTCVGGIDCYCGSWKNCPSNNCANATCDTGYHVETQWVSA